VFSVGAPVWLESGRYGPAGLRFFLAVLPASLVAIFAGVVGLLALFLDTDRRQYALDYADRCVDFAAVLIGRPRGNMRQMKLPAPSDIDIHQSTRHEAGADKK
jgi:hypothetical protein